MHPLQVDCRAKTWEPKVCWSGSLATPAVKTTNLTAKAPWGSLFPSFSFFLPSPPSLSYFSLPSLSLSPSFPPSLSSFSLTHSLSLSLSLLHMPTAPPSSFPFGDGGLSSLDTDRDRTSGQPTRQNKKVHKAINSVRLSENVVQSYVKEWSVFCGLGP